MSGPGWYVGDRLAGLPMRVLAACVDWVAPAILGTVDPTDGGSLPSPRRFWKVRPFFEMEDFGDSPAAKRGARIGLQK